MDEVQRTSDCGERILDTSRAGHARGEVDRASLQRFTDDVSLRTHVAPPADLLQARRLLDRCFGPLDARRFAARFWDGTVDRPPHVEPAFTLVFPRLDSVSRTFASPSELGLAEAYIRGDFDVEGDLEQATAVAEQVRERLLSSLSFSSLVRLVAGSLLAGRLPAPRPRRASSSVLRQKHSRARDATAVRSHYDVGNEFYSLWLDRRMVYSCAYFETGEEDIHRAQEGKLEHLCRKLRLQPGERLLDIGCGWGGLIRYAVARYGVRAVGVTLSPAQAALARERIADEGLADRCAVEVRDYRDLDESTPFDKVVSVGMFEHVGTRRVHDYFTKAFRLLKPGGLFLNHAIVRAIDEASGVAQRLKRLVWREGAFIDRYVFPDGELLPLHTAIAGGESVGFETRDVESLREHYVLTLRHWLSRLEAASTEAKRLVGAESCRVWRLYLASSAHGFASGRLNLTQVLFAKRDARGLVAVPLTRRDLYAR